MLRQSPGAQPSSVVVICSNWAKISPSYNISIKFISNVTCRVETTAMIFTPRDYLHSEEDMEATLKVAGWVQFESET